MNKEFSITGRVLTNWSRDIEFGNNGIKKLAQVEMVNEAGKKAIKTCTFITVTQDGYMKQAPKVGETVTVYCKQLTDTEGNTKWFFNVGNARFEETSDEDFDNDFA